MHLYTLLIEESLGLTTFIKTHIRLSRREPNMTDVVINPSAIFHAKLRTASLQPNLILKGGETLTQLVVVSILHCCHCGIHFLARMLHLSHPGAAGAGSCTCYCLNIQPGWREHLIRFLA